MSNNLSKCTRCGIILIDEEYDNHTCKVRINGKINVIEADYWIEGKHPKTGDDLISAKALDGTTYWIIKRSNKVTDRMPFIPPTNLQQRDATTEEGNRTKITINIWHSIKFL